MPTVRTATVDDAGPVAALAARTFPLACPPSLPREHIAEFVEAHLSEAEFVRHLRNPDHQVLVVDGADGPVGYALVLYGPHDAGPEELRGAPSAYLSKLYVDPEHHGGGVAVALLEAVRTEAAGRPVWLGVNADNARAKRFYAKSGFVTTDVRRFAVGETVFVDDVLVLANTAG